MRNTVKITPEAKEQLDWLKEAFSFTNFSIAIETVCVFFKHNKVNPRDLLSDNFSQTVFDLKQEMLLNFQKVIDNNNDNIERVIKIERRFEIDYFKSYNIKLIDIHKASLKKFNDDSNKNLIENSKENIKNDIQDIELKNLKLELEQEKKLSNKLQLEKEEYHKCLEQLNKSMRVEKFENQNRPYINLTVKEAEDLFYLIP